MNISGFVFGLCVFAAFTATAGEIQFQSPAGRRTSLVELYTSEGCSSCPPAEEWLSRLEGSAGLWTDFVPIAFHVDYWDNLGWRDRFASAAWTLRERTYASRWGSGTVYTPCFVRNGAEWQPSGSTPPSPEVDRDAGALSANVRDGRVFSVTYHPATGGGARKATAALLGYGLNTSVKAGENSGRALRHDFVVLASTSTALANDKAEFSLPENPESAAVAVWIENASTGVVEQATGGWLKAR